MSFRHSFWDTRTHIWAPFTFLNYWSAELVCQEGIAHRVFRKSFHLWKDVNMSYKSITIKAWVIRFYWVKGTLPLIQISTTLYVSRINRGHNYFDYTIMLLSYDMEKCLRRMGRFSMGGRALTHLNDMLASLYQSIDWTQHTTRPSSITVEGNRLAPGTMHENTSQETRHDLDSYFDLH